MSKFLEVWEPQIPGTLKAYPGLQWDYFTFTDNQIKTGCSVFSYFDMKQKNPYIKTDLNHFLFQSYLLANDCNANNSLAMFQLPELNLSNIYARK
jgi:hypothetical protein